MVCVYPQVLLGDVLLMRHGEATHLLCNMQKNIDKIQSNLAELEARLKHEQAKLKSYNIDMQESEARCVS